MNFKEKEFVIHRFTQDGCPPDEAKKESWQSMVDNLFDGDEEAAREEFKQYCKDFWTDLSF